MVKLDDFVDFYKRVRTELFGSTEERTYRVFEKLGLLKKDSSYFINNASCIVELIRKESWENFLLTEKNFISNVFKYLIEGDDKFKSLDGEDAALYFVETYPRHIYELSLSNTQSRRSCSGSEFEAIVSLIMYGAEIPFDAQSKIGSGAFKNAGKKVDFISPGIVEFGINKNNTFLISSKTTLRERWEQVNSEKQRTGAARAYLTTLDNTLSDSSLKTIYESNIIIVTTKEIKEDFYAKYQYVITFA